MEKNSIVVHTDGGSRGNPGPAAAAFRVEMDGKLIHQGSKFLGKTTNNQAEYSGVLLALDWLLKNLPKTKPAKINFILDSELVVKQINGAYKVKDEKIKIVFGSLLKKIKSLDREVVFSHVRREQNKHADFLVNQELDKSSS